MNSLFAESALVPLNADSLPTFRERFAKHKRPEVITTSGRFIGCGARI